ncbi:J domain-containing protein 1 [Pseudocercospora fuligena]|uniref:J domain-containing protein 1 n=1 Tax=Pseudocercospora fuligena TaxID=685502 RepID=A0A8H6RRG0_9PEZI|nr:J domain-containing protein 1 [Pseudocercospora fuligena]
MIIKRSSLLAANHLQSFHASLSAAQSSTSPSSRQQRQGTRPAQCLRYGYATVAGDSSSNGHSEPAEKPESEHVWPEPHKGQKSPTPYQIFDLKHDGKYSKAQYYKLVKLYHPDLHGNGKSKDDPVHQLKMERYRLIVAAHNILSDPTKRSAYDRFGAGWNGKAEVGSRDTWAKPSPYHPAGPFSQSWHDPNDPVWQNATWEDWERWRQHRDSGGRTKSAPVYMANSYFLAVVVALAIIGSSLNGKRASEAGSYLVEQRDIVHDRAAKELRKVRQEASGMTNRQDRIDFFIRQREATLGTGDYQALREEKANRVLKDREICASDNISEG